MKRFQRIYTLIFTLALTAFSAYALLDTFVLTRVYATVEEVETAGTYASEMFAWNHHELLSRKKQSGVTVTLPMS